VKAEIHLSLPIGLAGRFYFALPVSFSVDCVPPHIGYILPKSRVFPERKQAPEAMSVLIIIFVSYLKYFLFIIFIVITYQSHAKILFI
jgi:hypothetical protein